MFKLLSCIIALVNLGILNAQSLIIDTSFGVNGISKYDYFVNANYSTIFDENKNIYLFYRNKITYFDSSGHKRNLNGFNNPDTVAEKKKFSTFVGAIPVSNNYIFDMYILYNSTNEDTYVRSINKTNLADSTFGNKGQLLLCHARESKGGIGIYNKINFLALVSNYGTVNQKGYFKMFKIDTLGNVEQFTFSIPKICTSDLTSINFTNIHVDSKFNLYFGINYFCDGETNSNLVKLKSDFTIDGSFGNNGFLDIDLKDPAGNKSYGLVNITFDDNENIIYLLNNNHSDVFKIIKIDQDGNQDLGFGISGECKINGYNVLKDISTFFYDDKLNKLLVFAYNETQYQSKLFGISNTGNIESPKLFGNDFIYKGAIREFKKFNKNKYIGVFDEYRLLDSSQMVMFKIDEINNNNNPNLNNFFDYKIIGNKVIFKNENKSLFRYNLIGLDGRIMKDLKMDDNMTEIVVDLSCYPCNVYFICVYDKKGNYTTIKIFK